MLIQILVGAGLVLLLLLCLPIAPLQKLVLEASALVLRLALLALLGGAAFLLIAPDRVPAEVMEPLAGFPHLGSSFPEPGTPLYGACATGLLVVALVPVLAVLDVTRKLAGRRLSRLRALSGAPGTRTSAPPPAVPTVEAPPPAPPVPAPPVREEASVPRRTDRRGAADTLAAAGSRKPFRYTGPERGRDVPPGAR